MAKPYDAAAKELVELSPAGWLEFLGVRRPPEAVTVVDADVSAVTAAADKVIRVADDPPWLLHTEFQADWDDTLPARVLMYNAILHSRHRAAVSSVVFLLRPDANATAVTGRLRMAPPFGPAWEFGYTLVRVWKLPLGPLLSGPLSVLPLAPVAAARAGVADAIERVTGRIRAEADRPTASKLLAIAGVLLQMRYDRMTLQELIQRDPAVRDFVQQFVSQGHMEEAQNLVLRLGRKRLGPPPPDVEAAVKAIPDVPRLEALIDRVLDIGSWADLLAAE